KIVLKCVWQGYAQIVNSVTESSRSGFERHPWDGVQIKAALIFDWSLQEFEHRPRDDVQTRVSPAAKPAACVMHYH
ncbi:MAG: hypothetical protein IJ111_04775, partial [Eggerthellaceae bacterium]|nr:hypothetical protein [Eggerthellaceae bacterium]